ncbi:MAG: phage/plasmid primase, P4 family [Pseudomonadota bacterium]
MSSFASAAIDYAKRGLPVVALRPRSKIPATRHGKNDATTNVEQIESWYEEDGSRNVGILTGEQSRLIVVDIDPRNDGDTSFERLERTFGKLPNTMSAKTGGDGRHLYFSVPAETIGLRDRPNVAGYTGVDLKAGGYVVAAPSIHESGNAYCWESEAEVADAPSWLIDLACGQQRIKPAAKTFGGSVYDGTRNDTLFRMACSLLSKGLSDDAIRAAVLAENETCCVPPMETDEVEAILKSIKRYERGSEHPDTDLGNARRLVDKLDGNARYEASAKAWFVWDGARWLRDNEGAIVRHAKKVVDEMRASAKLIDDAVFRGKRISFAHKSQSSPRISAMIELAKTEPGIPINFSAFDRQPHLLNVANGMVDLRSGELLPHDREAFATHMIDIEYDPEAACPTFDRFVDDILVHDKELNEYVQQAAGYSATGETREQCLFFLIGEGANGKSTLLNTLRGVLGPYGKHTPTETLIAKTSAASNDLARLAGSRLVTGSEANADQRLADGLVKQITGDEPIVARFLFKEFIEFRPSFKIWLATNQLPHMNGSDSAIFRRLRIIPFNRNFTTDEQDRELSQKLEAEKPGILAWIVRGAMDWYENGLQTPRAVAEATAGYRSEMDTVGQFLEERCEIASGAAISSSSLYEIYRKHSNDTGRSPVSQTMFGRTLSAKGFRAEKRRGGIKYRVGLKLRTGLYEVAA